MIKQNLVIYSIPILFKILKEIEKEVNFNVMSVSNVKDFDLQNFSDYLILVEKKKLPYNNVLELNLPIKISKLIEKINIEFIKLKSKEQSAIFIGKYRVNLNARTLEFGNDIIYLTEKEVNLIIYLNNSNKSVNIKNLQSDVWGFKNHLETHTVETHIHRLRKKILNKFNKNDFILSDKKGYFLKKLF